MFIAREVRLTVTLPLPFRDSRRLAADNPYLPVAGVALDAVGIELDDGLVAGWRVRVERIHSLLGWAVSSPLLAVHATTTLAFAAPPAQLATALEVNEWALCAALAERDPYHWSGLRDSLRQAARCVSARGLPFSPPEIDELAAAARFVQLATAIEPDQP
jgi:hypothetical protein